MFAGIGLQGQYFDSADLSGMPVLVRTDAQIQFDWANGSPAAAIDADNFSVRWSGQIEANFTESHSFIVNANDGARLWVNGQLLIDQFDSSVVDATANIGLIAGRRYDIQLEYRETTGDASVRLEWSSPSIPREVIPTTQLFAAERGSITGDNSGAEIEGLLHAPISGAYQFYIAADGPAELWLSNTADRAQRIKIAEVISAVSDRNFTATAQQQSSQIHLVAGQTYFVEALRVGETGTDHLTIAWKQPGSSSIDVMSGVYLSPVLPTVKAYARQPIVSEGAATPGQLTVVRSGGPLTNPLVVAYDLMGTAINGTDYQTLPGTVTIPAGEASVTIDIQPLGDSLDEGDETVQINLRDGIGYDVGLKSERSLVVTIQDNRDAPSGATSLWNGNSLADFQRFGATFSTQNVAGVGDVIQVQIASQPTSQFNVQLRQAIDFPVAAGDVLFAEFRVRSIGGPGQISAIFEEVATAAKSLTQGLDIGSDWIRVQLPFTSIADYSIGAATFGFHLGFQTQTLQFADIQLVNYGPPKSLAPETDFALNNLSGTWGNSQTVPVTGQPFDFAYQVETVTVPTQNWHLQATERNEGPVNTSDTMRLSFALRALAGSNPRAGLAVQRTEGFSTVFSQLISATSDWQLHTIDIPADADYGPNDLQVAFNLGYGLQTIQIGGFHWENLNNNADLQDLPRQVPAISYDGRDGTDAWRTAAEARIESLRMSPVTVQVIDQADHPIDGAVVSLRQTEHGFRFGSAINAYNGKLDPSGNETALKYQSEINRLFNTVVAENSMKWPGFLQDRARALQLVDFANANDLYLRGHNVIWPSRNNMPTSVWSEYDSRVLADGTISANTWLKTTIEARFDDVIDTFRGVVGEWDVVNEPFTNHDVMDIFGDDIVLEWYQRFRDADPDMKLALNDYSIFTRNGGDTAHRANFEYWLQRLADANLLDVIGVQSHYSETSLTDMEILGQMINDYFTQFNAPIAVTEFDVNTTDEQLQADYLRDFMTMTFSQPAVNQFLHWGFWQESHWLPDASLYRSDFSIKPNGQAYEDLVFGNWWTDMTGTTRGGSVSTQAFIGQYDVLVQYNGATYAATMEVDGSGNSNLTVVLTDVGTAVLSLDVQQSQVGEGAGAGATTATLSRTGDLSNPLVVTLVSSDITEATVPATVTIPAGHATSLPIAIDAVDDRFVDGTQSITITASAEQFDDVIETLSITDDDSINRAGANLAYYEFTNHTDTNPELFSSDTHLQTTASDISSPLPLFSTGNGLPPRGLALGGAFNETTEPTPASGQPDYFQFTITPNSGYTMNVAAMSLQVRRNDPDSKNSIAVYFDEDSGPGGNNFTTKILTGVVTSEDVFETFAVDLYEMPEFANITTPLTFRVYAWGTAGVGTMRLDNITVQAVAETVDRSSFAYYGDADRLVLPLDAQGNRIADFSTAGYMYGNVPIPDVVVSIDPSRIVTVTPTSGDDMSTIQAAIDQVQALAPDANGFRGVVQLTAGEFQISNQIQILASGVLLRGVGDGSDAASSTILRGTGTGQRSLVQVGAAAGFASTVPNTTHNIVEKYVPVGATSFLVDSTANWSVGDEVMVRRPSTAEWISEIGMDNIPPANDGSTIQWAPGSLDQFYERIITRIEGNRIFLNAPITTAIEQRFGGGTVYKYTFPRINNVGVENMRGVSDFAFDTDEDHAWTFIELQAVQNAWVTNVTGQHFGYATVHATSRSRMITVDDAVSLDPKSIITGARRYPFVIDGQFTLMQNLFSEEGRHDFVNNAATRNRGPNVFLNGTAVNSNSSTGPHQRWSTGTLYDTIITDNQIEARNRDNFGTGHGWAGANMVFWNTLAQSYIVQNPPTAQNWLIGGVGPILNETLFGIQDPPTVDAHQTPIDFGKADNPLSSLYVAQWNQRVGSPTFENREYTLGDYDQAEFDGSGSADEVFVNSVWQSSVAAIAGELPLNTFDAGTSSQYVLGSFAYNLAPDEAVVAAILTLGLRSSGGDTTSDQLWLDNAVTSRPFSTLGQSNSLSTSETTPMVIELTDSDLLLLQDGLLNLAVGGNSVVDWATLQLTVGDRVEVPVAPPQIIDNGDVGYSAPGFIHWPAGYLGDLHYAPADSGLTATWTFINLLPGAYEVAATWVEDPNRATNAIYTVNGVSVAVNQQHAPVSFTAQGAEWESLGITNIAGNQLIVTVTSDGADGFIIADAIRIQRMDSSPVDPYVLVSADNIGILDTGIVHFEPEGQNKTARSKLFTVTNQGQNPLTLANLMAPAGFQIVSDFGSTTLAIGESTTFVVVMETTTLGTQTGNITFDTNDPNSPTFTIGVSGNVIQPLVTIIDDGDVDFTSSGWTNFASGFNGDLKYAAANSGLTASWTIENLLPGQYRVSATWTPHSNRASDARYSVNGTTVIVDQTQAPNTISNDGAFWHDLAIVDVIGNELVVTLGSNANGFVIADAIRLERIDPYPAIPQMQIFHNGAPFGQGDSIQLLPAALNQPAEAQVFTITNVGSQSLELTSLELPSGFLLNADFGSSSLAFGESTTFSIELDTSNPGSFSGTVRLHTNDIVQFSGGTLEFNVIGDVIFPMIRTIDDGDAGFAANGFTDFSAGFQTDTMYAFRNTDAQATWTFSNLTDGDYRVAATWIPHPNRATNSPFDVGGTLVRVNQEAAPDDFSDHGVNWENLAIVSVDSGQLVVTLASNGANEYVIADAIRLERVSANPVTAEVSVSTGANDLIDGLTPVSLGVVAVNGAATPKQFTVTNEGLAVLELFNLAVPTGVQIISDFSSTQLAIGEAATFTVALDASDEINITGDITFDTNDPNEGTFNIPVNGLVTSLSLIQTIDNGDTGYTANDVTPFAAGFQNDLDYAAKNSVASATWTFTVTPGSYQVSATWIAHSNRATNAPYTINGGVPVLINQRVAPSSFADQGVSWQNLGGAIVVTGNEIVVTLGTNANGFVIADAIRVELIPPPPPFDYQSPADDEEELAAVDEFYWLHAGDN